MRPALLARAELFVSRLLRFLVGSLMLGAVLLNFANVVGRYLFRSPFVWAEEIMQFMHIWAVMLGAAIVTRSGIHLKMDAAYNLVPRPARRIVDLVTNELPGSCEAEAEARWDEAAGLSLDVVAYSAPQEHTRGQRRREERPAMDHIGMDVHTKESQICILTEAGELIERRVHTEPERFAAVLGDRPRARILLEASTDSEWVARCLEGLGHEVIVADPNFAPMYATRTRKVKTDRRDARALAEACRLGAYRPAHRRSDPQRHVRGRLLVRDTLVRTRTRCISLSRALLRQHGYRVPSGSAENFPRRVLALPLPGRLLSQIAPLLAVMRPLTHQLAYSDAVIAEVTAQDERVQRLRTVPSVGPVTAAAFVATIDDVRRFRRAHEVEAYLGLVPRELSSGESQHRGPITKGGDARIRWLLIQAAVSILRRRPPRPRPSGRGPFTSRRAVASPSLSSPSPAAWLVSSMRCSAMGVCST